MHGRVLEGSEIEAQVPLETGMFAVSGLKVGASLDPQLLPRAHIAMQVPSSVATDGMLTLRRGYSKDAGMGTRPTNID